MRWPIVLLAVVACGGKPAPHKPTAALARGTQRIAVDGGEVVIDVRGSGPVCIVHPGGPGLESTYLHLRAFESRFTVVYIDPLGTGGSSKLPAGQEYSLPRDAASVEAVRAKLGLDRVCLIGHSYGGFVAQMYAVTHPEHVRGLFLYSTTPTSGPEWLKLVEQTMTELFKSQSWFADASKALEQEDKAKDQAESDAIFHRELPLYFADWTGRHTQYESALATIKVDFDVAHRRPQGKNADYDVRRKLGMLRTTPTVIVTGDKDFSCGVKPSTWIADSIAGSKLVVIENAGHFAHLENPGAFDAALDTFAGMLRRQ